MSNDKLYNIIPRILVGLAIMVVLTAAYFPNGQLQADWNQSNNSLASYIRNKPATAGWDTAYLYRIKHYNSSGVINQQIKQWHGAVTPGAATGNTLNISSAGFGTILSCSFEATSADGYPHWVKCTAMTNTQITYSVFQPNTNLINVLGNLVLLGNAYVNATGLAGITIRVTVTGY